MDRISIIGNIAGGKTTLSRALEESFQLPLIHIDHFQFLKDMQVRPISEVRKVVQDKMTTPRWIIDGFGPLDLLEPRLRLSDKIIFIDLPLRQHRWWLFLRQLRSPWQRRTELPVECNEASWLHTKKLFSTQTKMDRLMLPELRRILSRDEFRNKTIHITTKSELNYWLSNLKDSTL